MKKWIVAACSILLISCGFFSKDEPAPDFEASENPVFETVDTVDTDKDDKNKDKDDSLVNNDGFTGKETDVIVRHNGKECVKEEFSFDLPSYDVPAAPLITKKKSRIETEEYDVLFNGPNVDKIFLKEADIRIDGRTFSWIDWADLDVVAPSEEFRTGLAQADPVESGNPQVDVNGELDLKPYINSENKLVVRLEAWAKAPTTNRDIDATLTVVLLRDCS